MLVRSDMIFSKVGENTNLKFNSRRTVQHQALGRHFHHNTVAAFFHHLCKILMDGKGFRSRIICRNRFITNQRLNGTNQSHLMADSFQNRFHHIGCGCLSLGSCNSNHFQFLCRISKISGWHQSQRISGIIYMDDRHSFRRLYRAFHNHGCCSFCRHIFHIRMSVWNRSADTDKDASRASFSGIVHQLRHFYIRAPLHHFIFQTLQHLCQFHIDCLLLLFLASSVFSNHM